MSTNDHKQIATDFLMLASKGNSREAFSKYVGKNFKHHNIYFKGDGESLMIAMEDNAMKNPNKICDIKRSLQDGDLVATHSHVRQKPEIQVQLLYIFFVLKIIRSQSYGTWDSPYH